MKTEPKTKVIFRYWKGDIIALFPELPGADRGYCSSYQHTGQHSDADILYVIGGSRLARKEEYQPLYDELVSIGYNLDVKQKYTHQMQLNRVRAYKMAYLETI